MRLLQNDAVGRTLAMNIGRVYENLQVHKAQKVDECMIGNERVNEELCRKKKEDDRGDQSKAEGDLVAGFGAVHRRSCDLRLMYKSRADLAVVKDLPHKRSLFAILMDLSSQYCTLRKLTDQGRESLLPHLLNQKP